AGVGGRTCRQGYVADTVSQKFTAYEDDAETNLEYAEARYYSSSGGRFTSTDPFSGSMSLTDPQSLNRYSYVSNNPVNSTDHSGMIGGAPSTHSFSYGDGRDIAGWFGSRGNNDELEEGEARYEYDLTHFEYAIEV